MLDIVLPFAIINFLIIASGVAILAIASGIGAVLFQIPARDTLTAYTPPIIALSLGITLVGSFLHRRLPTYHKPHRRLSPIKPLATTPEPRQFTHVLVAGGKEAENAPKPPRQEDPILAAAAPIQRDHYEDMAERTSFTMPTGKWGSRRNDRPPLTGPPDKIEPRIDAISFTCQECKRTLSLPSQKAKIILSREELEINCPYCGQNYPFDYERAQKKTLSITFRGVIGKEWRDEPRQVKPPEPTPKQDKTPTFEPMELKQPEALAAPKIVAPEPPEKLDGTMPTEKSLIASFSQSPVGDAAKAIRTSSKALVGSLMNNRVFQTVASRIQPNSTSLLAYVPSPGQFDHVLVPGGKEGESITEIIAASTTKWAPPTPNDPLDSTHGTFEDMSDWLSPESPSKGKSIPRWLGNELVAIPDRLALEIDGFTFNCGTCDAPIRLPWTAVEAGVETPPFTVDCPSCRHQFTFDYGEAKRKTLNLRFKPYFELANLDGVRSLAPESVLPAIPQALVKVEGRPVALAVTKPARYSPGLEYDRAILEKG